MAQALAVETRGSSGPSVWGVLTALRKSDQASEDHIDLFIACLEWSLELEGSTKIKLVPAALANRLLSDVQGRDYSKDEVLPKVEVINKRVSMFRRWFEMSDELCIPVYAPKIEKSCQHWTMLRIKKSGPELVVQYFDSLKEQLLEPCQAFHAAA